MRFILILFIIILCWPLASPAQSTADVYVDKKGVMRWGKTDEEVQGFGINYTAMFAHAYRAAKQRSIPLEKAMDEDIYHFSRLGFDLYRVHVWDTEISDTLGNLLDNEHLRLFDYAVSRMKERGFRFFITPIAFWGNGWPEPDEKTPGFSAKYGKDACLTNPDAIKAQKTYLAAFLNHVNPFTGKAYKDEPAVIAFEVSNEPHHREEASAVTAFINGMVSAMRSTGSKKPIFYNISHSIQLAEAYAASKIQGGTFQWYPTGLGSGHELGGNLLPNVDRYDIPFAASPSYQRMAKVVYEFDAADVGRSYIYPAMARSFREAGIQTATHFAYDPTYMADVNTEYGTHYMNLAYAPQKALSLKIAAEVFHKVPMNKRYGGYPANTTFDVFRVNYEQDLAEMVTPTSYYYTNHTLTPPPSPASLEHIAGWGDSPLVSYEGTGAYFLDRIQPGVWRLEVMPDAIWLKDPFAPASPRKQVAVINWRSWPMKINLVDLGSSFSIQALNEGNVFSTSTSSGGVTITPGTYLLTKSGTTVRATRNDPWGKGKLGEYAAPASSVNRTYIIHQPLSEVIEGGSVEIEASIISKAMPTAVELHTVGTGRRMEVIPMTRVRNYHYKATLPAMRGFLRYYIVVHQGDERRTFPADDIAGPGDWDFAGHGPYEVRIAPKTSPIYLFEAGSDARDISRQWVPGSGALPIDVPGKAELQISLKQLAVADPENKNGQPVADYSLRYFFGNKVAGRRTEVGSRNKLILNARSLEDRPFPIQVALIMKNGTAYGAEVKIEPVQQEYTLSLASLKPVPIVTLPRPYPTFLPYFFEPTQAAPFDPALIESLQLSIGPGMDKDEVKKSHAIAIRSLRLE
ncbi:MAG: membrane or secreted protein [Cyclobacteriaceae bacterium]|nr:membrane or secreted protein [Cyclobacteriaceae bacterium]